VALLDLLLPPACAGCGTFGQQLCATCESRLKPASRPEDRFFASEAGILVGDALTLAMAAYAYEGTLRRVLQRLKYGGSARLAAPLAAAAIPALETLLALTGPAPLVPIPLHPARQRQRGYDQAALLAAALASRARCDTANLLIRRRPTTKQHRLDRNARLRNLRDAFGLGPLARPPPSVILVDDILTTGATLEACASVLLDAGCRRVYGFAIAREV
jgi:ComF family protein